MVSRLIVHALLVTSLLIQFVLSDILQTDFAGGGIKNPSSIKNLEVMCGKDHMTVQLTFSEPFKGMVFSKGQYGQPNCIYVKPFSNAYEFAFKIYYNKCGTQPDLRGRFYENTVIVQYDADLIEVWDEAKRLRCEWYNDYEKTASKPPMVIADLDVVELNFRGDNVDCWMEIQDGKGPWANPITGIVPLGSTLTMVIAINDKGGEFDMRVKSCEASNGYGQPIYLSDETGCVLRPKMVSKFMKLRSNDGRATVITYAHFHAFKFPDSMSVHLKCKVEICRYGCPDHCQKPIAAGYNDLSPHSSDVHETVVSPVNRRSEDLENKIEDDYDDLDKLENYISKHSHNESNDTGGSPRSLRKRRTVILSRHKRETNVGVENEYQVISEADLEFTLEDEKVTIFKGQKEHIIPGICLPAPSFSLLFVLLAMCTVISVLIAGFMCHHRQMQKDSTGSPSVPHAQNSPIHYFRTQFINWYK